MRAVLMNVTVSRQDTVFSVDSFHLFALTVNPTMAIQLN